MVKKRRSTTEDYDRFIEHLEHEYGRIDSNEKFEKAYNKYMEGYPRPKKFKQTTLERLQQLRNFTSKGPKGPEYHTPAEKGQKKAKEYNFLGTQNKGRTQRFARKIETKKGIRYIDSKGRYVSVKK